MNNYATKYLGQTVTLMIDRPIGTKHPKHSYFYELNYGYVPGTVAPDGEGVDAYIIGINYLLEIYVGQCVAVIHRTNDDDDKLIVVPPDYHEISNEEIYQAVNFQEQWFKSIILR